MSRENILFGIIGILLGFIVGFMFASSMSQKMQTSSASMSQDMPSDHPPVSADAGGGGNPDQVRAHIRRYVMPGLKADPAQTEWAPARAEG